MRDIKIKIDGNKLDPTTHVKYLGILIESHLNWKFHVDDLSIKLIQLECLLKLDTM